MVVTEGVDSECNVIENKPKFVAEKRDLPI